MIGSRFLLCMSFEPLHTIIHCYACAYMLDDLEGGGDARGFGEPESNEIKNRWGCERNHHVIEEMIDCYAAGAHPRKELHRMQHIDRIDYTPYS